MILRSICRIDAVVNSKGKDMKKELLNVIEEEKYSRQESMAFSNSPLSQETVDISSQQYISGLSMSLKDPKLF